jgi:hypothetical protein
MLLRQVSKRRKPVSTKNREKMTTRRKRKVSMRRKRKRVGQYTQLTHRLDGGRLDV